MPARGVEVTTGDNEDRLTTFCLRYIIPVRY